MHDEEMLTWLLFYTSLLDLGKTRGPRRARPRRHRAEPGGRDRGRRLAPRPQRLAEPAHACVALPQRAVRLRRPAHRARDRRHLRDRRPAARRTASISCRSRKTTTTTSRPAPTSPPEAIARLAESQILYDRDGPSEYFQVYTQTLDNGFFFEIVERRNYAGFGAVNAPIRLAAQTRLAPHPAMPRA